MIGALLGGPLGIGTLIFMLSVENVIQWSVKKIKLPSYEVQRSEQVGTLNKYKSSNY